MRLRAEKTNVLLNAVFKDPELISVQIRDQIPGFVFDGDVDDDQVAAGGKGRLLGGRGEKTNA